MLQTPVEPSSYSLRAFRKSDISHFSGGLSSSSAASVGTNTSEIHQMADHYDDDDSGGSENGGTSGGKGGRTKSRRELPAGAVGTLKAWLLSPEHFTHPYPTPQDQAMLMQKTGIDKKQLKNWFTNARRRIWKPMLKKQIEQGNITATGGTPGVPGGLIMPTAGIHGAPSSASAPNAASCIENPHSIQAMRVHYQQAVQQQHQEHQSHHHHQQQQTDAYGNPVYAPDSSPSSEQYYVSAPDSQQQQQQQKQSGMLTSASSIGTLPQLSSSTLSLSKTDSHAVLMELFARDQDLVRQATESARLKAESRMMGMGQQQQQPGQQQAPQQQTSSQHPMKAPNNQGLQNVPTLNSWPHFSSINSLNNLGTIPGVKSITSLSGADLATKGNLGGNKMGNLAQVKSMESMGKNDSYAFLEVFFGDRSSTNLSGMAIGMGGGGKEYKSTKGDEDNEIGLSLEDESPSHSTMNTRKDSNGGPLAPISSQDSMLDSGTLKRAYDDALAARGLMSVSRSSEKLTDLVLPAKIQRTLSQELMSKGSPVQSSFLSYGYTHISTPAAECSSSSQLQYPGQQPGEPIVDSTSCETDGHVKVSSATKCAICQQTNVDTQLRPCGHMFHERCLKPSFQTPMGQPKCPVDGVPIHSAVLAVPTDDCGLPQQQPKQQHPQAEQQQQSTHRWSSYPPSIQAAQGRGS